MRNLISTIILVIVFLIFSYLSYGNNNFDEDLLNSILGTIIGGLFLSLIYFLLYDLLYKVPNISGEWEFTEKTLKTAYNPYQNLEVKYLALIWNEGNRIYGSGEKIYEKNTKEEINYEGDKRIVIDINGYLKKRYFWYDEIVIHYSEEGRKRKSSTIHKIRLKSKKLSGSFFKTAANSSGTVVWNTKNTI